MLKWTIFDLTISLGKNAHDALKQVSVSPDMNQNLWSLHKMDKPMEPNARHILG